MADDNKWQEYLNKQADLLNKGVINQRQYNDAVKDAKAGLIGYSDSLRSSTEQLKKNFLNLGSAMVEGKQGASVYNQSISGFADFVDTVLSKFGFIGKMLGTMVTAGAKYVVAVNEQSDKLFETYQDISRTGLSTGMDDIFTNLQNMGYTMKDIGKMGALMKENSTTLANFAGTAASGAKQLGLISRDIQYSDVATGLKRMGMTTDDINSGTVAYMRQLQLSGALQLKSNQDLTSGAQEFIEEQDRLTKLTGINAKTQNEIYEKAVAQERFSAVQAELAAKGDEASVQKAKRNKELLIGFSAQFGDQTSKAFADYASGTMTSEEAQKFQRDFPKAAQAIDSGIKSSEEILDLAHKDAAVTVDNITELAKQGLAEKENIKIAELIKGSQYKDSAAAKKALEDAKKEQGKQKAGDDKQVAAQVDLRQSQLNQTQAFDKLVNDGIGPVTGAVKSLSKGIEAVTGLVAGVAGKEGKVGSDTGAKGPPAAEAPTGDLSKFINFGGSTGDMNHFKQLNPAVANGFAAMAKDYFEKTGKKLQLNSAYRSAEEQANTNSGNNPKAAPGKSLHQQGKAIDTNSSQRSELASLGLLSKYGFSLPPFEDPPHIQMPQAATGGILSGPTSGYQAMLHGTEAVVPMNGKKAVTVENRGDSGDPQQMAIIAQKISAIDTIINGMIRSNNNNTKILQRLS